jgi:hypothetical protein
LQLSIQLRPLAYRLVPVSLPRVVDSASLGSMIWV